MPKVTQQVGGEAMVLLLAGIKQHRERCCGVCSGCWQQAERASQSRWHLSLGLRAELKFTSNTGPPTLGQGFDDAGALGLGRRVGWLSIARAGGGGWSERHLLPVRAPSTPVAAWAIVTASSRVSLFRPLLAYLSLILSLEGQL